MGIRQKPGTGVQRLRAPDRSTGCGDYREDTAPGGGGWRWRPQTEIRDRAPDRRRDAESPKQGPDGRVGLKGERKQPVGCRQGS